MKKKWLDVLLWRKIHGIRFWKGNAAFNRQKDHDFAPNEWFRQTVVAECRFASFDKGGDLELTKKHSRHIFQNTKSRLQI